MAQVLILLAIIAGCTGCTTTGSPIENPRAVWCDHNKPRRDATETTPRGELDDINAHNRKGELWCGWKP
jgi:hypothetical protein